MSLVRSALRTATVLAAAAPLGLLGTAVHAAQSTDQITCDGHTLTIRANESHSSDQGGWSSVQVLEGGKGHLTPLEFSGTATDTTIDEVIWEFSAAKGRGHASSDGSTTCTTTYYGTLGDFLEPGDEVPAGAALTDEVALTFTAVVLQRGA
jgi:hypothetical protein